MNSKPSKRLNKQILESLTPEQRKSAEELFGELQHLYEQNPLLKYEPHPKQIEFHKAKTQLKAFMGGNRSGKTTAGILDDIIQAVDSQCLPDHLRKFKKFEPPFHCRVIVPGFDTMQSVVFQKLREWCPKDQLVGNSFDKAYEKSRRILRFKNGSFFDFLSYDQDLDKFGGAAKHRIHYDEEPPFDIRQEGKMRLMDYEGADELFTMTPTQGMSWMFDWIYDPWTKGQLPNATLIQVNMDDNPYLSAKQKEMLLVWFSREELEARKEGKFVHFHGMIYPEFSRSIHVVPESGVPPGSRVYVGIDPGVRHMAAVVWTYLTPEDHMFVFEELTLQHATVEDVCNGIRTINLKYAKEGIPLTPNWYVIDPSARNIVHQTGRSDQMEFTKHGIVTILGQNSVTAGINAVKERLQNQRLYVMANCSTLIDEFRKYRWATPKRSENDPKEAPIKENDHVLDALRYVVLSMPTVPKREEEDKYARMNPLERAMYEEMTGKSFKQKRIPRTQYGGIFA